MIANRGKSLLMNTPSIAERKPRPIAAPRDANAGKHAAQPIADTMMPTDPSFSNISEPVV